MQSGVEIITTVNEASLLLELIDVVHGLDPDMLLGWNITTQSWGYVAAWLAAGY